MQQGGKSQRHSFQVRHPAVVIPLLYNGSARIGLLAEGTTRPYVCSPVQLGGPFGFCAFALLAPCGHSRPPLLGSLEIALKRTRPRRRIYLIGRYSMTEGGMCQEGEIKLLDHFLDLRIYNTLNHLPVSFLSEKGAL